MAHDDYLFRSDLAALDPEVADLIGYEEARQANRLILIPSESTIPTAIREATGSVFQNIYAEGYPLKKSRWFSEAEILDYDTRLAEYRRYADERYYKGTEYADVVEALARRRAAELFATDQAQRTSCGSTSNRCPAHRPTAPSTPRWSNPAGPSWAWTCCTAGT
jgi:glycine hydroxymethyltransferase